jgi:hypothetical protein
VTIPVDVFVIVTVAPMAIAPLASLTVPAMVPVETWAKTLELDRSKTIASMKNLGCVMGTIIGGLSMLAKHYAGPEDALPCPPLNESRKKL